MKHITLLAATALLAAACGNRQKEYDATGTFEATEVTIYAEETGQLLVFDIEEGDSVIQGGEIGLIDTTQIYLKRLQLQATKAVFNSQKPDLEKQIAATRAQLAKARQEQQRYADLVSDGAVARKTLDDWDSQVTVLQRQLDAQTSALATTTRSLDRQAEATEAQIVQIDDQLRRCHVVAPLSGLVLDKYVERGELVAAGKPLCKVADMSTVYLRAYVTSEQLQQLRTGQGVTVFADYGAGQRKTYEGTVAWIASQSEFTPKSIVTDNERADLVYAVKVRVSNDGFVKIGMYGEVKF